MVTWHQRHGFCANCGTRTGDEGRRLEARMPELQGRAFSAHRSGRDHAGHHRRPKCLLGRQKQFMPGMYSCLAGFVEAAETIEDAVRREIFEESGIRCTDVNYYMTQPWPYPSSLMIGCTARAHQRGYRRRPHRTRGRALVRPRRGRPDAQARASRRPVCRASVRDCAPSDRALGAWGKRNERIAGTVHGPVD